MQSRHKAARDLARVRAQYHCDKGRIANDELEKSRSELESAAEEVVARFVDCLAVKKG